MRDEEECVLFQVKQNIIIVLIKGGAAIFSSLMITFPLAAWYIINEDWQFQVAFLDLTYKPWRVFVIFCGFCAFSSALGLAFLPESPKFVLSQGNQMGAYEILVKMNRWNNGKKSQLEEFEIVEEAEAIENKQRLLNYRNSRCPLLKSVWNQTALLFKSPYLKSTILLCTIQFGTYLTSNGFFIFFAEIINKMSAKLDNFVDQRIMMCDVINMKSTIEYDFMDGDICVDKLESSTLTNGLIVEVVFALGSTTAGLLIHKVGKFPIICKYRYTNWHQNKFISIRLYFLIFWNSFHSVHHRIECIWMYVNQYSVASNYFVYLAYVLCHISECCEFCGYWFVSDDIEVVLCYHHIKISNLFRSSFPIDN